MGKRIVIFIGIILVIFAVWLLLTPTKFIRLLIDDLEHLGYDLQLRTHVLTKNRLPTTPVAIVDIDDKSIKAEGKWPWTRTKMAELVTNLHKEGAAVVAFDVFFSEKENNPAFQLLNKLKSKNLLTPDISTFLTKNSALFDHDSIFANSLMQLPTVLAIGFLSKEQTQNSLPPPLLVLDEKQSADLNIIKMLGYIANTPIVENAATGGGFINIFPDDDGIIRRAPLLIEYKNGLYPSLSLQAVLLFLGDEISLVTPTYNKEEELEGIRIGSRVIPTDATGKVLIPFIGKSYTFPYYSATDVLHGTLPKDALLGKIIFVGTSATGLGDLQPTSIQNPYPGVEIHATIVNGILENNFSSKPEWTYGANLFLTILFGLIAAFLFPNLGPRTLAIIVIFVPTSLLFINNLVWEKTGLILSFLIPTILLLAIAIVNIIYGYLFESRRRERLKDMFGQYVPEKHIDEMLKTTSSYALRGEDREMSVLFADIRDFTTISEGLSATELVELLNTFFTPMTEIIFNHHGTIDKYVGDLIMAFWGAPLKDDNHTKNAIISALEMQKKLFDLNQTMRQHHWPMINMGIGINSGIMSVGDMGSQFRRNYTVLGDAVNLASRVESLTKFYGVKIAITESTQQNHDEFIFRKLDRVQVKGKKTGITIYEVLGFKTELTPELESELKRYETGLNFYFNQEWDEAEKIMRELQTTYPDKKIYHIYLERIAEYKSKPPEKEWDGIYIHVTK